jgi:predicted metalloprotease with PDZ domain
VTRTSEGRVLVESLRRGTPAYGSGLDVGDELLAVDEWRVPAEGLESLLALYRPGQRVAMTIARLGEVKRIEVSSGARPAEWDALRVRPDATPEQRAHLEALLGAL